MNTPQTVSPQDPAPASRVVLLDYYRYVAVSLALVSHVLVRLKFFDGSIGPIHVAFKMMTRMALPSLLILFGIMITLAYGREKRTGSDPDSVRIIIRILLCYLAFVALAALSFAVGEITPQMFGLAMILAVPVMYANIFKFYFLMLFAAMPLLRLRRNAGMWTPVFVALLCFLGASFIDGHAPWRSPLLNGYSSALYGLGREWGPSILHSLVLVVFGMSYGSVFRHGENRMVDIRIVGMMLAVSAGILMIEMLQVGVVRFAHGIADIETYRVVNHPVYFAYGIWGAVVMTAAGWLALFITPRSVQSLVQLAGRNTFTYFFIGNAFVLLLPSMRVSHAMAAVIVGVIVALSMGWVWLWTNRFRNASLPRTFFARLRDLAVAVSAFPGCRLIFRSSHEPPRA